MHKLARIVPAYRNERRVACTHTTAGGYCPIGSSYQQPCPSGTYNNFSGAANPADCTDCPPGFYCSGTSNPAPTGGCSTGHYCTGGSSSPTQFMTQSGFYAPVGSAQQYPCLPGTFQTGVRIFRGHPSPPLQTFSNSFPDHVQTQLVRQY